MTMQCPEVLIVESGAVEVPPMQLFAILVGDMDNPKFWARYKFTTTGDPSKMVMCTALWCGYISTYRLRADGTLTLERLEYPFTEGAPADEVKEVLTGDFWLDLRKSFMGGDEVKIPFIDGKIQADQSLWRRSAGYLA